jgi:hypothetical protein
MRPPQPVTVDKYLAWLQDVRSRAHSELALYRTLSRSLIVSQTEKRTSD